MKNIVLTLVMFFVVASLNAKDVYIKIANLDSSQFFTTAYAIEELGYTVHTIKYQNIYKVYAGPFKNRNSAQKALGPIRSNIASDASLVFLSNGVESKYQRTIKKKITPTSDTKKSEEFEDRDFFVALSLSSVIPIVDENDPNFKQDNGLKYGLEFGYHFTDSIFVAVAYEYADLDETTFTNILTKLDYKFASIKPISPYAGLIVGYSTLEWNSYINSSDTASSLLYGLELGGEIDVVSFLALDFSYSYRQMDFVTNYTLENAPIVIENNGEHSFNFALKYRF